jgi:cytidylate kinase
VAAVDGRSGAGKTTLAHALAATVPRSAVVHTDDVAWFLARFDWVAEMRAGVLEPVRRGEAVAYRPPPWDERSRPGAVEVPAPCDLLVVEGVGAARAELADLVDRAIWVQSDREVARERGIERDGGDVAGWDEWQSEEVPFLERDRPWERVDVIVAGTGLAPAGELLVAGSVA